MPHRGGAKKIELPGLYGGAGGEQKIELVKPSEIEAARQLARKKIELSRSRDRELPELAADIPTCSSSCGAWRRATRYMASAGSQLVLLKSIARELLSP